MEKKKNVYEEPLTKVFPIQVKGCFCQSQPTQNSNDGDDGVWDSGSW